MLVCGQKTYLFSVHFPFLHDDESTQQLSNFSFMIYNLDDGQSPKEHFTHYNVPSSETFELQCSYTPQCW
jgi:hypothetical protein